MSGIAKLSADPALGAVKNGTTKALMLQVQYGDPDDVRTAQHYGESGDDTQPVKGCRSITLDLDGLLVSIATWDGLQSAVNPGEKKIYALAPGDPPTPLGSVYLKKDGSVAVASSDGSGNPQASLLLKASGMVSLSNQQKSLATVLVNILTHLLNAQTVGSPALHVLHPTTISNLTQDKADLAQLLE